MFTRPRRQQQISFVASGPGGTLACLFPLWQNFFKRHETGPGEDVMRKILGAAALAAAVSIAAAGQAQYLIVLATISTATAAVPRPRRS